MSANTNRAAPTAETADATPCEGSISRSGPHVQAAISDFCRGRITDKYMAMLIYGTAYPGGMAICEVCPHRVRATKGLTHRTFRGRGTRLAKWWFSDSFTTYRDLDARQILVGLRDDENGDVVAGFRDEDGWHELIELEEERDG